jgi:PleD family two-component response regulator
VTVSIGIATASPLHTEQLVVHADQALYSAKHAGRNRFESITTENV